MTEKPSESATMKTIGLLGGMSPESTIDYYRRIHAGVHRALGRHHSARMYVYSADLDDVLSWLYRRDHAALGQHLGDAAEHLERSGADFVLMACNSAHAVAPQVEQRLTVPLIHIADVLGEALRAAGVTKIGLLGTGVTMGQSFYRDRLESRFGVEVLLPDLAAQNEVDRVIREELCFHRILDSSRRSLARMCRDFAERGADAAALACTELNLLIEGEAIDGLPVFDTTALHADRAVTLALGKSDLTPARKVAA